MPLTLSSLRLTPKIRRTSKSSGIVTPLGTPGTSDDESHFNGNAFSNDVRYGNTFGSAHSVPAELPRKLSFGRISPQLVTPSTSEPHGIESDFNRRRRFSYAAYVVPPQQQHLGDSSVSGGGVGGGGGDTNDDIDYIGLSISDICVICLGPVDTPTSQKILLPCTHMFCTACVQRILIDPMQPCPACRIVSNEEMIAAEIAAVAAAAAEITLVAETATLGSSTKLATTTSIGTQSHDLTISIVIIRRVFLLMCVFAVVIAIILIAIHFSR